MTRSVAQQSRVDLLAEREAIELQIQQLDASQQSLTQQLAALAMQIRHLGERLHRRCRELVIFDVEEATDYLFSSRVLSGQVEARRELTEEYERLRAQAEQDVLSLVTRLDDIAAGIEAAQRDIQRFSE